MCQLEEHAVIAPTFYALKVEGGVTVEMVFVTFMITIVTRTLPMQRNAKNIKGRNIKE